MADTIHIRAVAYQHGESWLVQGLEHDILARAKSLSDAPKAFMRALFENLCINRHLGRAGLDRIAAAPDRFSELFEKAHILPADEVGALRFECDSEFSVTRLPRPDVDLRVLTDA